MTKPAELEPVKATRSMRVVEEIPEFNTPPPPSAPRETVRFKLDGDLYVMSKPKVSIAMTMMRLMDGEDRSTVEEMGFDLMRLVSGVIAYIETQKPDEEGKLRGQARILQRLSDPKDRLDVMDLFEPFGQVIAQAFGRPIGSRPASGGKPRRTKSASGAASRSPRARTSTT